MIVTDVLEMLALMFREIFVLVDKIFTAFDAWSMVIGAFTIYAIYRLLLIPVLGGSLKAGSSDNARKKGDDD